MAHLRTITLAALGNTNRATIALPMALGSGSKIVSISGRRLENVTCRPSTCSRVNAMLESENQIKKIHVGPPETCDMARPKAGRDL